MVERHLVIQGLAGAEIESLPIMPVSIVPPPANLTTQEMIPEWKLNLIDPLVRFGQHVFPVQIDHGKVRRDPIEDRRFERGLVVDTPRA